MSFRNRTHVIGVQGGMHIGMPSSETALLAFGVGTRIRPRLVWLHPDQTPTEAAGQTSLDDLRQYRDQATRQWLALPSA